MREERKLAGKEGEQIATRPCRKAANSEKNRQRPGALALEERRGRIGEIFPTDKEARTKGKGNYRVFMKH